MQTENTFIILSHLSVQLLNVIITIPIVALLHVVCRLLRLPHPHHRHLPHIMPRHIARSIRIVRIEESHIAARNTFSIVFTVRSVNIAEIYVGCVCGVVTVESTTALGAGGV